MSWTIGAVQLPVPPMRQGNKNPVSVKKVPVGVEAPWIYHMGADAKIIALDGEIYEAGRTETSGLHKDYIERLQKYTEVPMAITVPFMDVAPTGTWATGAGVTTFKNTGDKYVKNDESLYVVFGANDREIYYDYGEQLDFRNHNIVSIWVKGTGSEKFAITFYNEDYASKTNGYRQYIQASNTEWAQNIFVMSSVDGSTIFNDIGTPTGWRRIRTIVIEPSGSWNPGAQGYYFDAGYIGVGWKVTSPNGYFDGIYDIQNFEFEREGAETEESFNYRMQLVDETEMFGKEYKVVQ